jgi:hypothetical protein
MVPGWLESSALKVAGPPVIRASSRALSRIKRRVTADHSLITKTQSLHHLVHGRFSLYIAAAPSQAPKQVPPEAFADRALAVAREILAEPFITSGSDGDRARFTVPDPAPGKLSPNSVAIRWPPYAFSCGLCASESWDSSWRSCWTAVGMVKPVGPTLTQDQRPSLTTGTPALAMLSTKSPAR